MDLTLFVIFFSLSLILIILGLFRTEHTELALVGFLFLFLLSFLIINSDIQQKTGEITNSTVTGNFTQEITTYQYADIDLGGTFSHSFGYWLAVMAIIGFIGCLIGIKHSKEWR